MTDMTGADWLVMWMALGGLLFLLQLALSALYTWWTRR